MELDETVFKASIHIVQRAYTSICAVTNDRYEVILGMAWQEDITQVTKYDLYADSVNGKHIRAPQNMSDAIKLTNIRVKNFCFFLQKTRREDSLDEFRLFFTNSL